MGLAVIGAGFGRTGTLSLKAALEQLGFGPCHHMIEVLRHPEQGPVWLAAARGEPVDFDALLAGYRATVDWPGCHFWRELAELYPEAKVLLSVRDPGEWYDSIAATTLAVLKEAIASGRAGRGTGSLGYELVVRGTLGPDLDDRDHAIEVFRDHVARVRAALPPERLLVYDVREGWAPLCRFLGVDVPTVPFPRTNSRDEFHDIFFGAGGAAGGRQ